MTKYPLAGQIKSLLCLLPVLLCFLYLPGQPTPKPLPRFKNFNSSVFSNNEVKAIQQTSDGSIWIATSKGLFQLAGGQVLELELPAGINNNMNSLLLHKGFIYAGSNNGLIRVELKTQRAVMLPVLHMGNRVISKYIMVADVNGQDELLFYTGYDTSAYYKYNLNTGTTSFLFNKSDGLRTLQKDNDGKLVKMWAVEASGLLEHTMDGYRLKSLDRIFLGQNGQPLLKIGNAVLDENGALWCTTDKGLLAYQTASHRFELFQVPHGENLIDLVINGSLVYCATRHSGILIFNKSLKRFTENISHIPDDPFSIGANEVCKLQVTENGLLVVVTERGISCMPLQPSLQLVSSFHFGFGKTGPSIIKKDHDDLVVGGGTMLKRFSASFIQKQSTSLPAAGEKITSLLPVQDGVVATTQTHIFLWQKRNLCEIKPLHAKQPARSLLFVIRLRGDSVLLAGGDEGLFEINLLSGYYIPFRATSADNYQRFHYAFTVDKCLLVNTYYSYIKILTPVDTGYVVGPEIETFSNIYDYLPISGNEVLLAGNGGLAVLNLAKNSFEKITPAFAKSIYSIHVAGTDTLLVTETGLWRYQKRQVININYPLNSLVKPAGPFDFLCADAGMQLFSNGQLVQLPFDASALIGNNKMWMKVQPSPAGNRGVVQLNAADKKWQLDASVNNYHPFIEAGWQYQLSPADTNWQAGETNRLVFENLAAGSYLLKLRAICGGKIWFSGQIRVEVAPAWFQTNIFKLLLLVVTVVFFFLLYRFSIRRFKKKASEKEALRQRILELESKAFRAQMNPHFVFNTLNSINSCILEKETDKASDFLTQFSRLIRLTLENSNQDVILLEKELETVKLYLSIEQKRLENAFAFDIKIDEAIVGQEWRVPPMIIQPFIENAIWHGLVHKQQHGAIHIGILLNNGCLNVSIEDNGIGRKKAAMLKSGQKLHNSLGTPLTLQRLRVFHPQNNIVFTDLTCSNREAAGTLVQLIIYPEEV